MNSSASNPKFEQMIGHFDDDIDDFVPLLSHLSEKFRSKSISDQHYSIDQNLDQIRKNKEDTAVFISTGDDGRIMATATANRLWTPSLEGWVDDVVTLPEATGRGLGRAAMNSLHEWFDEKDVETIRLTSAASRGPAGNLYESMGYVEGGTVWRADLYKNNTIEASESAKTLSNLSLSDIYDLRYGMDAIADNADAEEYDYLFNAAQSETSKLVVGLDVNNVIARTAIAATARIPSGNKAWLYDIKAENFDDKVRTIREAHGAFMKDGISSANVMTFEDADDEIIDALLATGYDPRDTRLYTRK